MAFNSSLPAALLPLVQSGHLEKGVEDTFKSVAAYRSTVEKRTYNVGIGTTTTDSRMGLFDPNVAILDGTTKTGLDDGLVDQNAATEQWTMTINRYAKTSSVDLISSQTSIARQFKEYWDRTGINAAQALERKVRDVYLASYGTGRTYVTTALSADSLTLAVDDVRGFETVLVNGVVTAVSGTNPANVSVNGTTYILTGVVRDPTSTSKFILVGDSLNNAKGASGTLTFKTAVKAADGAVGKPVVHAFAPSFGRANSRDSYQALTSADKLTGNLIQRNVTRLRNNTGAVNTSFDLVLSPTSMGQLQEDAGFMQAFQGQYSAREIKENKVFELWGARFIQTTEAPVLYNDAGVEVHMPLLVGPAPVVEGRFAGMDSMEYNTNSPVHISSIGDTGVNMYIRSPLNRLGDNVNLSWQFIGGWAAPTDATNTTINMPTTNGSPLKRAQFLQHGA